MDDFMRRMATMLADTDYRVVGNSELYFQNAFYLISRMLGFYTEVMIGMNSMTRKAMPSPSRSTAEDS